jgi:uncharacterized protein
MKCFFCLVLLTTFFDMSVSGQRIKDGHPPIHYATLKGKQVLVFTKNGKGYVHENIPAGIAAFQKLGRQFEFKVDTSSNAFVFTETSLKNYDAVIFSNTNNDVFDTEEQKVSFMRYMQAGGGFMGIHSASGTERNWKWFKLMLGATFVRHPPFQTFTVYVLDKQHPATKNLAAKWETKDECYYFKEFNPSIKTLVVTDMSTIEESNGAASIDSSGQRKNIKPDVFGNRYPAVWCNEFDGGRIWYTALGHSKENYSDSTYLSHLVEGLKWVVNKKKPDYRKAYATSSVFDERRLFGK